MQKHRFTVCSRDRARLKKKSELDFKARFLAVFFLILVLTFYAHCAIVIIERVHR